MTSTPRKHKVSVSETLSIAAERARVGLFPAGSRQLMVGNLWVAWLEHFRDCQDNLRSPDCTRHFADVAEFEASYPDWHCCNLHRKLMDERRELEATARSLPINQAPHQTDEVLTPRWWRERGYPHYFHNVVTA